MDDQSLTPFVDNEHPQTMSSREIAELVEVRHDSVRRTIERLAERAVIQLPPLVEVKNHLGQTVGEYRVGKRDSYVIVAQLSPEFTARLVDRWQQLEQAAEIDAHRALSDPASLRHLLLENVEKVLALQGEVEEMRPQVQALERIAISDGSLCFRDAAKTLQVRPKDLTDFLMSHGWVYTRMGVPGHIAYQSKLQAGLLEHKTTTVHRSDGSEKVVSQCRITPKGLTRLAKEFPPVARAA